MKELKGKDRPLLMPASITVPITTLAPEPFKLLQTIYVVVQPSGDEYVASFFDANVNASGSNETEAVENLKDILIHLFAFLSKLPVKRLGPSPKRQLAVLQEFIRKR